MKTTFNAYFSRSAKKIRVRSSAESDVYKRQMLESMKEQNLKHLHKNIWDFPKLPVFTAGRVDEASDMPLFSFSAEVYEVHAIVNTECSVDG